MPTRSSAASSTPTATRSPRSLQTAVLFPTGHVPGSRRLPVLLDPYGRSVAVPSGETLIDAQGIWKEKKDGGRPVAAVFVADVSGSMAGTRLFSLQRALRTARGFISAEASVGMVEFGDRARKRLDIAPFDLNQQASFAAHTVGEEKYPSRSQHADHLVQGFQRPGQEFQRFQAGYGVKCIVGKWQVGGCLLYQAGAMTVLLYFNPGKSQHSR